MSLGMHDENQQVANIKVIGIGGGGCFAGCESGVPVILLIVGG